MSKISTIQNKFSILANKTHTLGYCPITGIITRIEIPNLPSSKILTYKNPLSTLENAEGILSLPYIQVSKTKIEVIAGCLLTLLTHHDLIEDKLSSVERNEILCTFPIFDLYNIAKIILASNNTRIAGFPSISLQQCISFKIPTLLKIYAENCLNSSTFSYSPNTIIVQNTIKVSKTKTTSAKNLSKDDRAEIKRLVSNIIQESLISSKLQTVLGFLYEGSNLRLMPSLTKKLIIAKLDALKTDSANKLSNIIFESIEDEEEITQDSGMDKISYGRRKTIKEILAEKQQKEQEQKESNNE